MQILTNMTNRDILDAMLKELNLDTYTQDMIERSLGETLQEAEDDTRDDQIYELDNDIAEIKGTLSDFLEDDEGYKISDEWRAQLANIVDE